MRAAPNPRTLTGWFGASPHVLRFPLRAFLRFPVCPPGSSPSSAVLWFPFVRRSPVCSLRPLPRFRFPSVSLRVPFPLSNVHVSAAAGRFRRRWSRAAGTKVTSSAATTSLGSRDPPALQMGSRWTRWDVATESPVTSGRERRTSPPRTAQIGGYRTLAAEQPVAECDETLGRRDSYRTNLSSSRLCRPRCWPRADHPVLAVAVPPGDRSHSPPVSAASTSGKMASARASSSSSVSSWTGWGM